MIKNLIALSGGEQSFVAIAIYFAILRQRPTPFCIMDEIDAALDEGNVRRYVQYLQRFRDTTQFILITHRRMAMEAADALYGVTMQEDRSRKINVRRMRYPFSYNQTLNASGYQRNADGWNITFTSGYDFEMKKLSMTTMSLSRDLHCFEMSCSVVLKPYSSFNFTFRARASELADALKWDKRSSYSTNVEWY